MVSTSRIADGEWIEMREVAVKAAPSPGTLNARRLVRYIRNDSLVDFWSITHVTWAAILTVVLGPWWAFGLMLAWEPFEILLLGPLLARKGIVFGHESWRNAVSDVVFDAVGVALAFFLVLRFWDPVGIL